ncbi:MAG: hypothetical protein K1W16_17130 [Lachnospiraceae bacterium]|jgi:hypothetical protein
MKKKARTIFVNKQKFVWWYTIDIHITKIYLSPFEDKTSKIIVDFPDKIPSLYGQYNESIVVSKEDYICLGLSRGFDLHNEKIVLSKGEITCCIKIVAPKMAGLLLDYFTKQENPFVPRKIVVLNGYDLLSSMGYQMIEIKKGLYW